MESETELVVWTKPHVDQLEVGVIEMEVTRQSLRRGRADVVAVRLLLFGAEEVDRHRCRSLRRVRSARSMLDASAIPHAGS